MSSPISPVPEMGEYVTAQFFSWVEAVEARDLARTVAVALEQRLEAAERELDVLRASGECWRCGGAS